VEKYDSKTFTHIAMKKIGIIRGMETTFPDALIENINTNYSNKGVHAEFIKIDHVRTDAEPGYEVIIDRISHEVPFFRSYLKWAALKGTYIINNPFWWSADDKFIDNEIAARAGVAVPRTVILPHKIHPPNTFSTSFRNLSYPVAWDRIFEYVGFPSFLKPHDGGGWRDVTKVTNEAEFYDAYNTSGQLCMMLQEGIEFTDYYRCYGIGRKDVHIMRYNPGAESHKRYQDVPEGPLPAKMQTRLKRDVLAICNALGYDMNTVEFAVRAGIPYAIDFMNPAPDADYNAVGADNFFWIVNAVSEFAVKKATGKKRSLQFTANGLLEK
jgi:glutathione synthase/RimK-type ligase-like ATP-grasp enzyme